MGARKTQPGEHPHERPHPALPPLHTPTAHTAATHRMEPNSRPWPTRSGMSQMYLQAEQRKEAQKASAAGRRIGMRRQLPGGGIRQEQAGRTPARAP